MKRFAYLVTGLALTLCLASCGGAEENPSTTEGDPSTTAPSTGDTSTTSQTPAQEVEVYLILGEGGLYKGQAGSDDLIDDFNVVKFKGKVGDALPGANDVTNTNANKTFNGWMINGAAATKIMGANGHYTALWKENGGSTTSDTSGGGGDTSTTTSEEGGYLTHTVKVTVGSVEHTLTLNPDSQATYEDSKKQSYQVLNINVQANDSVVLNVDGVDADINFMSADAGDPAHGIVNNVIKTETGFKMKADAVATLVVDHYDKFDNTTWDKLWMGVTDQGGGGDTPEPFAGTVTIKDLPTWIEDHGCKVFVWSWGGENDPAWVAATINGTSATVELPVDRTGFNMARCHKDTVTPNWELKDEGSLNTAGRVYAKTGDYDLSKGNTFSAPESSWQNYFC